MFPKITKKFAICFFNAFLNFPGNIINMTVTLLLLYIFQNCFKNILDIFRKM